MSLTFKASKLSFRLTSAPAKVPAGLYLRYFSARYGHRGRELLPLHVASYVVSHFVRERQLKVGGHEGLQASPVIDDPLITFIIEFQVEKPVINTHLEEARRICAVTISQ